MAFFAKSRRKLRTKNFEAQFHIKLRTLEKCSNVKKLRTTEPQPTFTGSYKKKECNANLWPIIGSSSLNSMVDTFTVLIEILSQEKTTCSPLLSIF